MKKEIQIALAAIVAVVLLFFGIKFLKGMSIFQSQSTYYVTLDEVSGLAPSSPVYANGYKVGTVTDIVFDYSQESTNIAVVALDQRLHLPKGTAANIESDMLGNIKLNLTMHNSGEGFYSPKDTIVGNKEVGLLDKVGNMMPTVESMLPKIDSILGRIDRLLADPAMANSLHNFEETTKGLTVMSKQLSEMSVTMNREVPTLLENTNKTMENTERLTKQLSEVEIAAMMEKLNGTIDNLQQLSATLNSDKGTLGLLMNDPGLYNRLNQTISDADSLMVDLKAHPKRYVHFSVFGKKN